MKQQPMQQVMPRRGCGIGLGFGDVVESLRRGGIFTRGLRRNLIETSGFWSGESSRVVSDRN